MEDRINRRQLHEPIAVVGIGCRYPGKVNDPESFWKLIVDGRQGITEVPSSRWDKDALYDPDPDSVGKLTSKYGGFVSFVDEFDAGFFGIGPREATRMDPQQRLSLMTVYEALEDAGLDYRTEKDIGVFVGVHGSDYQNIVFKDLQAFDMSLAVESSTNTLSTHISYLFDFHGPSLVIETDRSSSLAAVHFACLSIASGDCKVAVCGGTNLVLTPLKSVPFSNAGILAPDGRCKFGSSKADGITRSDGIGFVVLKKLSDAIKSGDRIYSTVISSSINHCGAESGDFIRPSQSGQKNVIEMALKNAKLHPNDITFIEAHGTGTPIGDLVELSALNEIFQMRQTGTCHIGSVKTNIGHTEAAAGIASFIKASLSIYHKKLPKSLFCESPLDMLSDEKSKIKLASNTLDLSHLRKVIGGVSSFGLTGTNVHVIVSNSENNQPSLVDGKLPGDNVLAISARSKSGLSDLVERYIERIDGGWNVSGHDICYTASRRRINYSHRLAVLFDSIEDLKQSLRSYLDDQNTSALFTGEKKPENCAVAFVFPGQGSQSFEMGKDLYQQNSTFKEAIDRCASVLDNLMDVPLKTILYGSNEYVNNTKYAQPAIFAIEYALVKVLEANHVRPSIVLGHSVGEYVAATVAGVLTLDDALKLIATRGRLMAEKCSAGSMLAARMTEAEAVATIANHSFSVSLAALNGPQSLVFAGSSTEVDRLQHSLEQDRVVSRKLHVNKAFHSPMVEPMIEEFRGALGEVEFSTPRMKIISNLSGNLVHYEIANSDYWVAHTREPVKFWSSLKCLASQGVKFIIEVGAAPIHSSDIAELMTGEKSDPVYVRTLRSSIPDSKAIMTTIAQLFASGLDVDFSPIYPAGNLVSLPTFPWDKVGFWYGRDYATSVPKEQDYEPGSVVRRVDPISQVLTPINTINAEQGKSSKKFGKRILDKLLVSPEERHEDLLTDYLTRSVNILMDQKPTEKINANIDLQKIGFNSYLSVRLRNQMSRDFNKTFNAGLVFSYPTISKLARFIALDFKKNRAQYEEMLKANADAAGVADSIQQSQQIRRSS